ncbi:MAG: hypothetical protein KC593_22730 [Myxococcales bacterium]|nr:hypothetical protein [Myxococcales bacterium]
MRWLVPMVLLLAALLRSTPAAAQECDVEVNGVGLGFVFPEEGCQHTLHMDLTYGFYTRQHDPGVFTSLGAELGFLERIDGSFFQLGPVVSFTGAGAKHDWEGDFDEFAIAPQIRGRLWMLDGWATVEMAAGPDVRWMQVLGGEWMSRVGARIELGPTFHGVAGIYVGTSYIPPRDDLPGEFRTLFGFRANLTAGGIAALLGGGIYACAKAGPACR